VLKLINTKFDSFICYDWHPSLPKTLVEIEFAFPGSATMWLRPKFPGESIHWTMTTPNHPFVPVNMGERFPNLRILKIQASSGTSTLVPILSSAPNEIQNLIGQILIRELPIGKASPEPAFINVRWTDFMFGLWVKLLPATLTTLHLAVPFTPSIWTPYLPVYLQELNIAHVKVNSDISHQFQFDASPVSTFGEVPSELYSSLNSFRYKLSPLRLEADLPRFAQLRTLDLLTTKILGSQLHLLPHTLKDLAINCLDWVPPMKPYQISPVTDLIMPEDLVRLPRSLLRLRLYYIAPLTSASGEFDFIALLPPKIVSLALVSPQESLVPGRQISRLHLASISSHLRFLQHLEIHNVSEAFQQSDWVPKSSLLSLKLLGGFELPLDFFPLPSPCHLSSLTIQLLSILPDVAPRLPRGLTQLKILTSRDWDCWELQDWKQFRSSSPPSLTRFHLLDDVPKTIFYPKYRIGKEIPSTLTALSELALQRIPTSSPPFCFNWASTVPELPIHSLKLPQSITSIDLASLVLDHSSPLLSLLNLINLRIRSFEHFEIDLPWLQEDRRSEMEREAKLKPLSDALEPLIHLKKLCVCDRVTEATSWLHLGPLQRRIVDLEFITACLPELVAFPLANFTVLDRLDISSSFSSMDFTPLWRSIPRCISHLSIDCIPLAGFSTIPNFPKLKSLIFARYNNPVRGLSSLAPNLETLRIPSIAIDDVVGCYAALARDLIHINDLDLVQTFCPSVTSLPSFKQHNLNGSAQPGSISWIFARKQPLEQISALRALPQNLSHLVWPQELHPSTIPQFPCNLTSLELSCIEFSTLNWVAYDQLPPTLKVITIASMRPAFPANFLAWLPRGLEILITNCSTLSDSDLCALPPSLQKLMLPELILNWPLPPFMTSLTCLILEGISADALESVPSTVTELQLLSRNPQDIKIPPTLSLSYLPFTMLDQNFISLAKQKLEIA
jgi:hypothetical protein